MFRPSPRILRPANYILRHVPTIPRILRPPSLVLSTREYGIKTEDVYEDFRSNKEMFDFSNYATMMIQRN